MTAGRPRPRQGIYDEPFWQHVSQGELRLQQCTSCSHLRYPPAAMCPRCMSFDAAWQPLSGRGTVFAWTVFHRQYFPQLPAPYAVVSVRTEEGPLLIGNLVDCEIGALRHGMPVRAVFADVEADDGNWKLCQWTAA